MDKKLTLSLNEKVIEQAKIYAKKNQTSLSRLVESYLASVIDTKVENEDITPLIKSLSGIISLPADFDFRKENTDYLLDKYK